MTATAMPGTASVEILWAERAIRRLISHYCAAVGRRDAEAIGDLFAPDAVVTIAGGTPRHGPAEIVEGLARTMSAFEFLHQKCDTGLIDIDGKAGRCRNGVFEMNRPYGADELNLIFGIYEDRFVQLEEGWRFAGRTFTMQYRAVAAVSDPTLFPPFCPQFIIGL